jgi:hypothetical protein
MVENDKLKILGQANKDENNKWFTFRIGKVRLWKV